MKKRLFMLIKTHTLKFLLLSAVISISACSEVDNYSSTSTNNSYSDIRSSCSTNGDTMTVVMRLDNGYPTETEFKDNNSNIVPSTCLSYSGKEGNGYRYDSTNSNDNYYWLFSVPEGNYQNGSYTFFAKKYNKNLQLPSHLTINLFVENRRVRNNEIEFPSSSTIWGFEYKPLETWKDYEGVHGVIRSNRGKGRWTFVFPNYNGSVQLTAKRS